MGAAEGTFDFDLDLKKRSSVATILDKNSYTFNWIPSIGFIIRNQEYEGNSRSSAACFVADAPAYEGASASLLGI